MATQDSKVRCHRRVMDLEGRSNNNSIISNIIHSKCLGNSTRSSFP